MARLEAAADLAVTRRAGQAQGAAVKDQLVALRADRDRLSTALEELQKQYADMRAVSEAVATRLDATTVRVRKVLRS